jgi:uncharacterized protein (DUF1330 family)
MPGYFMGMIHGVSDEAGFGAYQGVAMPTIEQYGGKPILFSQKVEAADGDWAPMGIIVIEFESSEQSRKWYNSPEYQAVIGQRLSSTESNTVFMDVD